MIEKFNDERLISQFIVWFYEYSNLKTFKFVLKKVFIIAIYNLRYFYTDNELKKLFDIKTFTKKNIEKYAQNMCNVTDNEDLMDIIENEIY